MGSSEQMRTPEPTDATAETTPTALIVVDMQTAFTSADGALAVAGADRVVAAVNARIATGHGWPVFFTRDVAPVKGPVDQFGLDPALDQRGGTVVAKGPGTAGGLSGFLLGGAGHRLGYRVAVDLDASAFVHAHPRGDAAAVAELVDAGITVVGTRP